jgi:hypothetical protein
MEKSGCVDILLPKTSAELVSSPAPPRRRGGQNLQNLLTEQVNSATPQAKNHLLRARAAWYSACGPHLARHSEPTGWDGPLLRIAVEGLHWRQILFEQRGRLTGRLRRWLPHLRGIRLERRFAPPRPEPVSPPPAAPARVETEAIEDDALRAAFDRLLHARDARHTEEEGT